MLRLGARNHLGNIHLMGTREIATMTSETVLHPLGIGGDAFSAQPFQLRPQALGTGILGMNGQHRARGVAQGTLQAVINRQVIEPHGFLLWTLRDSPRGNL